MGFKLEHTAIRETRPLQKEDRLSNILQKEITLFGSFFNAKRKEDFYTELSVLLKAGINLRDALALLAENQQKEKLRSFYQNMERDLVSGNSFYQILSGKKEFTEYEYYSIKIGEETGNLVRITEELSKFYARKNDQGRSLVNALTYPMIILATAILVVVFMLRMVVPMFEDIFRQNKVDLPGITIMIINASNFIKDYGWMVLLAIVLLVVLRKTFSKKMWFKKNKDRFLLRLPYVGPFIRTIRLYARVTVDGKRAEFSLNRELAVSLWDEKRKRGKGFSKVCHFTEQIFRSGFYRAPRGASATVARGGGHYLCRNKVSLFRGR